MGRVSVLYHREEPEMGAGVRAVLGDVSGEVAVFGSLNADLTVRTERFPKPGETIGGEDLVILPGGKSANQAVQAGLLGARVRMIGAVGADGHGDLLIESLQRAGVDTSAVQREDVATGTAIITVDSTGDNTIVVSPGANGTVDVSTAQRRRDVIGEARVLGLCMEVSPDAVEAAARIAHDSGTRVVFNNSPFHPVLSAGLLEAIDVLVVNEHELADMLKPSANDAAAEPEREQTDDATDWGDCARRLAAMGIPSAVVTLGGRGSMVIEGEEITPVDPFPADVVDTTGAGDSLQGPQQAALAAGARLKEAAGAASAVSAFATTSVGAQASYGDIAAVEQHFG